MNLNKYVIVPPRLDLFRDYEKEMKEIEAKGSLTAADYKQLAALEAERNAKIDSLNSTGDNIWGAEKTNKYSGWNTPDYSKSINSLISSYDSGDKSPSYLDQIAALKDTRQEKAAGTAGMSQYVNDDFDKYVEQWLINNQKPQPVSRGYDYYDYDEIINKVNETAPKPEYTPSVFDTLKEQLALAAVGLNYDDWLQGTQAKQLTDRYNRMGNQAMEDVLGQISARTGGLASSYAQTVAAQQRNAYMHQLEEAAYDMFTNERNAAINQANAAYNYADNDRGRYLEDLAQFNKDRDYSYGVLSDVIKQSQLAQEWEQAQEDAAYDRALKEESTEYARAKDRADTLAGIGDYSGYRALGYSDDDIARLEAAASEQAATAAAQKSGSSGSGSGSSNKTQDYDGLFAAARESGYPASFIANNYKKYGFTSSSSLASEYEKWLKQKQKDEEDTSGYPTYNTVRGTGESQTVDIPGHGDYTWDELEELAAQGKVRETVVTVNGKKKVRIDWMD